MQAKFVLDRRAFLGRVALSVGGVAVASALPVSLLEASPAACGFQDPCGDWTVDDMCNAYPPYAFRRDADQPRSPPAAPVHRDGLDVLFAV
jgi:hypothetical protein